MKNEKKLGMVCSLIATCICFFACACPAALEAVDKWDIVPVAASVADAHSNCDLSAYHMCEQSRVECVCSNRSGILRLLKEKLQPAIREQFSGNENINMSSCCKRQSLLLFRQPWATCPAQVVLRI